MSLKINSTKITENIENEKGEIIGKVSFDPNDIGIYKKFLKLIDSIEEKQKFDEKIKELEDIPNFKLNSTEEFEKYRGVFEKLDKKLDNYLEMIAEIKEMSNEVFGNVSEAFEKVCSENSIEPYIELINWATPYFHKGRKEKLNDYLEDSEEVL